MGRYKVLKGVAGNLGQSFTSALNYREGDHVVAHLLRRARELGEPRMSFDLLTGAVEPPAFLESPAGAALQRYKDAFPTFVEQNGTTMQCVSAARIDFEFDLSQVAPPPAHLRPPEVVPLEDGSPFDLRVVVVDSRGREWTADFRGWEYPQIPGELSSSPLTRMFRSSRRRA